MSGPLIFTGPPVAAPVASSRQHQGPLWERAFAGITPGALSLLRSLSVCGGGQA
jgi:hypothetical protein